jgi:hypothetical protein
MAAASNVCRVSAVLPQQSKDCFLLVTRGRAPNPTSSGRLLRELERRRSASIRTSRIGAVLEQRAHGCGTARAHGTVQRGYAALVDRVRIGPRLDQQPHHFGLLFGVPSDRIRRTISPVVQRLSATPIAGAHDRAAVQEIFDDRWLVRGGCQMQRSVARVDVVQYLREKIVVCALSRCSDTGDFGGKARRRPQQSRCLACVTRGDGSKEHVQPRFANRACGHGKLVAVAMYRRRAMPAAKNHSRGGGLAQLVGNVPTPSYSC